MREAVAAHKKLPSTLISILIEDSSRDVIQALIGNRHIAEHISNQELEKIIARDDVVLLEALYEQADHLTNLDKPKFIQTLIHHADPCLRYLVAQDNGIENTFILQLRNDPDPEVKSAAINNQGRQLHENWN